MDDPTHFDTRIAAVSALVTAHRIDRAFLVAQQLTHDFPNRAHTWFWLALTAELSGRPDDAVLARNKACPCPDFTPTLLGDLERDRLLSLLRRRRTDILFLATLQAIRDLHHDDTDRLSCLRGLEGRHHYVCGRWQSAFNAHLEAHNTLRNGQWRFNNLFPFLKAMILAGQRKLLEQTYRDIVAGCPPARPTDVDRRYPGTRGILWRARLCRFGGRLGCRLDDFAEFLYWRLIRRA